MNVTETNDVKASALANIYTCVTGDYLDDEDPDAMKAELTVKATERLVDKYNAALGQLQLYHEAMSQIYKDICGRELNAETSIPPERVDVALEEIRLKLTEINAQKG